MSDERPEPENPQDNDRTWGYRLLGADEQELDFYRSKAIDVNGDIQHFIQRDKRRNR